MVSNRTIGIIRRRVNAFLTETCSIKRKAEIRGHMGEPLPDWETVASDVPSRVITINRGSIQSEYEPVGSTEALIERWRLICPVGTTFAVDNQVWLSDGRKFLIVDVDDRLTDAAFVAAVMVRARDG